MKAQKYSSTLSLNSLLDGGVCLTPADLPPGKHKRYPFYMTLIGPQCPVWTVAEKLLPPEFDSPTV
jgi:hypothetical protein